MNKLNKQDIKANKDVAKQGPVKYRGAWRPKVAEVRESFEACPHCNAPVGSEMAICPHCGRSLTPGKCSFCGSPMKPNAKFCTRCGQSGEGIVCPECGTLNSRNFCRRCNHPLTPMAMQAMEQAKKDPAFRAVQKKADELAEMQRKILELQRQTATTGQKPPELSDADKALLNEYADILASIGTSPIKPAAAKPSSPREQNEIPERRAFQDPCADLEDIMAAYREKAAELNQALAAMTPPPEYTPEQQRDYFSARKVMTINADYDMSDYVPYLWKCNLCGALHKNPPECVKPELGGTWIHTSVEDYQKTSAPINISASIE